MKSYFITPLLDRERARKLGRFAKFFTHDPNFDMDEFFKNYREGEDDKFTDYYFWYNFNMVRSPSKYEVGLQVCILSCDIQINSLAEFTGAVLFYKKYGEIPRRYL